MTRLQGLVIEAEGKASNAERRVSEMAAEVVEAYWKGEVFRKKLLESFQDACAKGVRHEKMVKHYPGVDLSVLSSRESSSGSKPNGSDIDEGAKATSPAS